MLLCALTVARYLSVLTLWAFLCGCATAPVEESRAFSGAAVAVASAGDLLFDALSIAERRSYKAIVKLDPRRNRRFDVADAPYFATIGEPNEVAAFRHSLVIVKQYSLLLVSLAEGESVNKTKSQLLGIATSLAEIAKFTQFAPIASALDPIINQAVHAYSVAEAKRLTLDAAPVVLDLIALLQNTAPAIFKALAGDILATGGSSESIEATKVTVANFVMLLESLREAFDRLISAYDHPSSAASLAALLEITANVNADVIAARKAFVNLRSR